MKLHPLLLSAFILGAATLHAQTQAPAPPATPAQEKQKGSRSEPTRQEFTELASSAKRGEQAIVGIDRDGSVLLTLNHGTVQELVKQLETIAPEMVNKGCDPWAQIPNIVYGPGAQEAEMPTTMRLRQVTPVQALALVSAAAGCTLQPISAPVENAGRGEAAPPASADPAAPGSIGEEDKIIGYRIELADRLIPATRNPLLSLVAPTRVSPEYRVVKAQAAALPGVVGVNPIGTLSLEQPSPQITRSSSAAAAEANSRVAQSSQSGTPQNSAPKTDEPSVRVYAVGTILRGTPVEIHDKQGQLQELVSSGISLASLPGQDSPNLSFHEATKTLIVKATAAQHDIISQIITALKENEAVGSAAKP